MRNERRAGVSLLNEPIRILVLTLLYHLTLKYSQRTVNNQWGDL